MDETGEARQVAAGSDFEVALEAKPTAGFRWKAVVDAPSLVDRVGEEWEPGQQVGGTAVQRFRFHAHGRGRARVTFEYARPGSAEPVRRHHVDLTVS